jgi:uncharacterized lipoprotein YajG
MLCIALAIQKYRITLRAHLYHYDKIMKKILLPAVLIAALALAWCGTPTTTTQTTTTWTMDNGSMMTWTTTTTTTDNGY